jgi:hypothetical protein
MRAPETESRLSGVQVLLVEDDEDVRERFGLALHEAGAEVRTACGAMDAMHTVLNGHRRSWLFAFPATRSPRSPAPRAARRLLPEMACANDPLRMRAEE